MSERKSSEISVSGSETAAEIYLAVGRALSYWEAAEDAVHDLYVTLCGQVATECGTEQPALTAVFLLASRNRRYAMLREALKGKPHKVTSSELTEINDLLRSLDKLAERRNQIAHGYCVSMRGTKDGGVVYEGNYLIPSLVDGMPIDRSLKPLKYAHTALTIDAFTEEVRDVRWGLIQLKSKLMDRTNEFEKSISIPLKVLIREAARVSNHAANPKNLEELIANFSKANPGLFQS